MAVQFSPEQTAEIERRIQVHVGVQALQFGKPLRKVVAKLKRPEPSLALTIRSCMPTPTASPTSSSN